MQRIAEKKRSPVCLNVVLVIRPSKSLRFTPFHSMYQIPNILRQNVATILRLSLPKLIFSPQSALAQNNFFYNCTSSTDCEYFCVQIYNNGEVSSCDLGPLPCFRLKKYLGDCISTAECFENYDCIEFLPQCAAHCCVSCYLASQIRTMPVILDKAAVCTTPTPTPPIAAVF